ncbi:MAG: RNA polymerase sigma factor [Proteobacteria bacterium]|nr:MAG: RNA polymerase sigma factor [Pseudomonadota bacterium]
MKLDELQLVERILKNDDRHAFRQLVLYHQSGLRIFLRRVLNDQTLADDCAQDTWIIVYQKLASYGGGSFRSWLLTIGMRNAIRLKSKEGRMDFLDEDPASSSPPEGLKLDLEKALAQLSVPQRSCLHLASCEEMNHEEISEVLNMPLGTVKSHINRAKEKLKILLGGELRKEKHDA